MSHISIIINRAPPPGEESLTEATPVAARVEYVVPHDATDEQVGKAVKRLYKQVCDLGA